MKQMTDTENVLTDRESVLNEGFSENVIDFHTHIFPDKIARSSIEVLENNSKTRAFLNGTVDDLDKSMEESGVTTSVILPVVTNPKQEDSILRFADNINENYGLRIVSFGGIHPDESAYKEVLKRIKNMGMKGVKIHPQYQKTNINDIKYKRIVSYANELDLTVVTHAGIDIGIPDIDCASPQMSAELIDDVRPEKLVLAHAGGWKQWDAVEELIAGKRKCFLDLSFSLGYIKEEQLIRIIKSHGADSVLFATDSPWSSQKSTLEKVKSLPFSKEEINKIIWSNAAGLLENY